MCISEKLTIPQAEKTHNNVLKHLRIWKVLLTGSPEVIQHIKNLNITLNITLTQKDFENKLEIMNRCLSMKET